MPRTRAQRDRLVAQLRAIEAGLRHQELLAYGGARRGSRAPPSGELLQRAQVFLELAHGRVEGRGRPRIDERRRMSTAVPTVA
jgi:hypothetical protein